MSYPARGMGIEIVNTFNPVLPLLSYPARGMGIEIIKVRKTDNDQRVIPREGYGDWNDNLEELRNELIRSYPARGMGIEIHKWDYF